MTAKEQLAMKRTLEALRQIGSMGMQKGNILELADLATGGIMSTENQDALWELLLERRYIIGHWEPVLGVERWSLTERGATALAGL